MVKTSKEGDVGIARRGIELGVIVREMIPGRRTPAKSLAFRRLAGEEWTVGRVRETESVIEGAF